jgi:hypothetical protein
MHKSSRARVECMIVISALALKQRFRGNVLELLVSRAIGFPDIPRDLTLQADDHISTNYTIPLCVITRVEMLF